MNKRIKHMVLFCLKHPNGSLEMENFFADAKEILSKIPGVEDFQIFNQISPKNDYDFGFSMAFSNQDAYSAYNAHPAHIDFVNQRWHAEVTRFLEIDLQIKA